MFDEILANRSQVLFVQALFTLKLMLSMSKPATLFFILVVTNFSFKPKLAELCLYFCLPRALGLCS
jgi:hypothetical protein